MSKRIVQQIVDVPVPQIPKQIVEVILGGFVVRLQRHERQHGWTCPQPPEQNVDVIKVILQEQCQQMRFFFWERVGRGLPTAREERAAPQSALHASVGVF